MKRDAHTLQKKDPIHLLIDIYSTSVNLDASIFPKNFRQQISSNIHNFNKFFTVFKGGTTIHFHKYTAPESQIIDEG